MRKYLLPKISHLYDRDAAVRYARAYAQRNNPDFPSWAYHGGGDCTNFVCQALWAGGWPMIGGHRKDATAWWCRTEPNIDLGPLERKFGGHSFAWTSASFFSQFILLSRRARFAHFTSELQVGDIVQMADGVVPNHTMIVTRKDGGELLLSYHSRHTLDMPFTELIKKYPKSTFLNWKVHDQFPPWIAETNPRMQQKGFKQ